jgi:hypothetical protein
MTAVKKIQQGRSKRSIAATRRPKSTRKQSKQIRFAKPSDGPGGPGDNNGLK